MEQLSVVNEETTSLDSPDPDLTGFKITGHRILIRPLHIEGKTKGGLILANKTKHDVSYLMNVGKVLALGDRAFKQEIFDETGPWCDVGDYVLIPKLCGQKIRFKGVPLTLVSCDQIMALVENPEDLDPHFNISTDSRA